MQTPSTRSLAGLACLAAAVALTSPLTAATAATPSLTVAGSSLSGATVPKGATVTATGAGTTQVTWVLDGAYVGTDKASPFTWTAASSAGSHVLRARLQDGAGHKTSLKAAFSVAPTTAPGSTPPVRAGLTRVADGAALAHALSVATPGTTIELADGTYSASSAFTVATACTASAPCTLRGGRGAVLSGHGTSGVYGLHLKKAAYWTVSGLTVTDASKGVVLDSSSHNVLTGLDVHGVGEEGIHLRSASSDNVVRGNVVRDTGRRTPGYGEGVYVGSASSNWATYSAGLPDRSDRNLVTGNTISDTGAESVDIKEGTTGGTLSGNSFDGTGMSGSNYADSWVDLKGNGWVVSGNRGVHAPLDGFQTHVAVSGWGQHNTFGSNVASTGSSGYGFRIEQPATSSNVVSCDNSAATARAGLANQACR